MAVRREDADAVRKMLAKGIDPDQSTGGGRTALAMAVRSEEITRILLEAGASADLADDRGIAPLQHAARAGDAEIIALLLEAGADPNGRDQRGPTALLAAAQSQHGLVGRSLLDAGAMPDAANRSGESPLFYAIAQTQVDLVLALLSAGAEHENVMTNGMTALGFAASLGSEPTVQALLGAGAGANALDPRGRSPLAIAAARGNTATVELLLSAGARLATDPKSRRPHLIAALEGRHAAVALTLLEAGADPTAHNERGNTALTIAAETGSLAVVVKLHELDAHKIDAAGDRALLAVLQRIDKVGRQLSDPTDGAGARNELREEYAAKLAAQQRKVAKVLVMEGADLDWRPGAGAETGEDARTLAARLGLTELLELSAE
jgi:ankyrin repeat protein